MCIRDSPIAAKVVFAIFFGVGGKAPVAVRACRIIPICVRFIASSSSSSHTGHLLLSSDIRYLDFSHHELFVPSIDNSSHAI